MKKVIYYTVLLLMITAVSCIEKKTEPAKNKTLEQNYSIDIDNTVLNWTAYKTTDKIPVKGVFQEVKIKKNEVATSMTGVLDDLEFEISVSSINSNDSIRDSKLKEFFFGVMKNTLKLTGTFHPENNGKGLISLTMNGLTEDLPFTFEIRSDEIEVNATMNLDNWQAQSAIEALNVVCNDKHKASDGISKTWNEVTISSLIKVVTEE